MSSWPRRLRADQLLLLGASAVVTGIPLIFVPLQIGHSNDSFLIFSSRQFLPAMLLLWLAAIAVMTAVASWLPHGRRALAAALVFGLAAAVWTMSWLMSADIVFLDRADGAMPSASIEIISGVDTTLWTLLAVFVAAALLARRFPRECGVAAVMLALGMLINAAVETAQEHSAYSWRDATSELGAFSSRSNVVVILLDAFQNDMFQEILRADDALREAFSGFTSYTDVVAPASTTYLSLPAIHSGKPYPMGSSISHYYDHAVEQESFMVALARSGHRALLLNPILERCPAAIYWCGHQASFIDGWGAAYLREFRLLLALGLRRSMPRSVAEHLFGSWEFDFDIHGLIRNSPSMLDLVARQMTVDDGPPRAKFLHLLATHAPTQFDENCGSVSGVDPWSRQSMRGQAVCALRRTAEILRAMKRHDVYENSAVFVISDHGGGFAREAPRPSGTDPAFQNALGIANAVLAHKPPQARGGVAFSDRPVALAEIPTLVCSAANCGVPPAFPPHDSASRRFLFYDWRQGLWTRDAMTSARAFDIAPDVAEPASWRLVETGDTMQSRLRLRDAKASRQLGFGWGPVNYSRQTRWVQTTYAQVYLPVPADGKRTGAIALRAAKPPDIPVQQLMVDVEGIRFCEYRLTDSLDDYVCRFELSADTAHRDAGRGFRIDFHLGDAPVREPRDRYRYAAEFESVELR